MLDEVSQHILDEETDMYPAARQVLAPSDWDAVDRAVAELAHLTTRRQRFDAGVSPPRRCSRSIEPDR